MSEVVRFDPGGYRYIKAVFQYSGGVAAEPGFRIERVRLASPLPLAEGFEAAAAWLKSVDRPLQAFCACELRSPAPFTEVEFTAFNHLYVGTLERWNIVRGGMNPIARTNVCPLVDPPAVPSLYAFSFTTPSPGREADSFIIAGGGEAPEGRTNYRDHIVRLGDTTEEGMRHKIRYVLTEMEARLSALSFSWRDVLATQAFTVHDIGPFYIEEIARRGAAPSGLTWHACRPPIVGLEYEMDVRAPFREHLIWAGQRH